MEWDQVINPPVEEEASKARVPKEEVQIPSQSQGGSLLPFLRLRSPTAWPWWEKWASKEVLHLLSHGVEPDFACPTLPIIPQGRSFKDQESALQIISDYMQQGACKEVSMEGTSYLVPWFVLKKKEIGGGESKTDFRLQTHKHIPLPQALQARSLEGHIPLSKTRPICCKTRFKGCILPFRAFSKDKAILKALSGGQSFPNGRGMLWFKYHTTAVD